MLGEPSGPDSEPCDGGSPLLARTGRLKTPSPEFEDKAGVVCVACRPAEVEKAPERDFEAPEEGFLDPPGARDFTAAVERSLETSEKRGFETLDVKDFEPPGESVFAHGGKRTFELEGNMDCEIPEERFLEPPLERICLPMLFGLPGVEDMTAVKGDGSCNERPTIPRSR